MWTLAGTAELAPTSCKWSKNQPEGKRSQFSNNQVPAKGTAERALTICKSSKDLAQKEEVDFQFSTRACEQKGTAERALTGCKSSKHPAQRERVILQKMKCEQKGELSRHSHYPAIRKFKKIIKKSVLAKENGTAERALTKSWHPKIQEK